MVCIRPVRFQDLDGLMNLARSAGVGLTSLPVNEERLTRRISRSVLSFAGDLERGDQGYVFVLEDVATGAIGGICALEAAVGLKEPWYNYRVGTIVHASEEMGVYTRHETLFLSNDHTGYSELCTLFLHPDFRVNRNGSLLSKCRFLFMAQFPQLFGKVTVAEMRGYSDEQGSSPFWEALGRHFFSLDFAHADYLTGIGQKAFVAELMPKYPVYIDFLAPEAQAVIGRTHDNTRPAVAMLEAEGFRYEGYVDIFDAGPAVECELKNIRSVRRSQKLRVLIGEPIGGHPYLLCNSRFEQYRACYGNIRVDHDKHEAIIPPKMAAALKVQDGDMVRVVDLD